MFKILEKFLIRTYRKSARSSFLRPVLKFLRRLSQREFMRPVMLNVFVIPEVQKVITDLFPDEKNIVSLIRESKRTGAMTSIFKEWHSGDYDVILLYVLMRITKPDTVVETGIASGRSSTAILEALAKNGKGTLYSIDLPSVYEGKRRKALHIDFDGNRRVINRVPDDEEPGWLIPEDLKKRWKRILGNTWDETPKLARSLASIDIFYHDSDHTDETMLMEFNAVWPKIPSGGFLLSDDVMSTNAFRIFKEENAYSYTHVYNGLGIIRKRPRVPQGSS